MGNNVWSISVPGALADAVLDKPRKQDVTAAPWAKWMVRGPTNRVFYDVPTLRKAEQIAREELQSHPGKMVEIYKLQVVAEHEVPRYVLQGQRTMDELKRRIDAYHALLDGGNSRMAELAEECEKVKARAEKLEGALKTIMLKFSDKKLCAKVAMEAMKNG